MARRRLQPDVVGVIDDRFAEWKLRTLFSLLAAFEPDSPAEDLRAQIVELRRQVESADLEPADAIAAFEEQLAELGLDDAAERHVARALAARRRWASPDDFAHTTERKA